MSDFLTRLALRAADAAPALRPRAPLRFETEAPAPAEWGDETLFDPAPTRPTAPAPAVESLAAETRRPAATPQPLPIALPLEGAQPLASHPSSVLSPVPTPSAAPTAHSRSDGPAKAKGLPPVAQPAKSVDCFLDERTSAPKRSAAARDEEAPAPSTSQAETPSRGSPSQARASLEAAPSPERHRGRAPSPPVPSPPPDKVATTPPDARGIRHAGAERDSVPDTVLRQTSSAAASPPFSGRADIARPPANAATGTPSHAEAPLPPVIVEIGRIEVRAPPSPPVAAPPRFAPRVSLHTYLDRRGARP